MSGPLFGLKNDVRLVGVDADGHGVSGWERQRVLTLEPNLCLRVDNLSRMHLNLHAADQIGLVAVSKHKHNVLIYSHCLACQALKGNVRLALEVICLALGVTQHNR